MERLDQNDIETPLLQEVEKSADVAKSSTANKRDEAEAYGIRAHAQKLLQGADNSADVATNLDNMNDLQHEASGDEMRGSQIRAKAQTLLQGADESADVATNLDKMN